MSTFNSSARRVWASTSPSHAWIGLHRCVEAYARLTGQAFSHVFEELGERQGFSRAEKPSLTVIQEAVRELSDKRAQVLRERVRLVEIRRHAGRTGRACPSAVAQALRVFEGAHKQTNALTPNVGVWGWRRLRQGQFGPAIDLSPLPGMKPLRLFGTPFRLLLDLRGWATPFPAIAAQLKTLVWFKERVTHLIVMIEDSDLEEWQSATQSHPMITELTALRSLASSAAVWLTGSSATPSVCEDLRQNLDDQRWRLRRLAMAFPKPQSNEQPMNNTWVASPPVKPRT